jgi:predicted RecA/RadA family phage recombinase
MGSQRIHDEDQIVLTASGTLTLGDVVFVGGAAGVVASDYVSGDKATIDLTGVFELTKATGFVVASAGEVAYWDSTNEQLVGDAAGGRPIGFYVESRLTGDTVARVMLGGQGSGVVAQSTVLAAGASFVAASAVTQQIVVTEPCTVRAIQSRERTQASSAAGTAIMTIYAASKNLLAAASVDMEAQVADTLTDHAVTATAADLNLDPGDVITISLVSNNADLTAGLDVGVLVHVDPR